MAHLDAWPEVTDDDGTGQYGTNNNKSFWDATKAEIEAHVHSANNPAIEVSETIDEVVEARGTTSSLNDRLDDVIDPGGNLILPASVANITRVQETIGSRNLLMDNTFQLWPSGRIVPATMEGHWSEDTANISSNQCGYNCSDVTNWWGLNGIRLTAFDSNGGYVGQVLINSTRFPIAFEFLKNTYVSAGCWIWFNSANSAGIEINDGNQTTRVYHTGTGGWQFVQVTHKISAAATELTFRLRKDTSSSSGYFFGPTMVLGQTPPSVSQPSEMMRGMIMCSLMGAVTTGDKVTHTFTRPTIIYGTQFNSPNAPSSNFNGYIYKWNGAAWQSIHSSPTWSFGQTGSKMRGVRISYESELNSFAAATATDNTNATMKLGVSAAGGAIDAYVAVLTIQFVDPFESLVGKEDV